MCQFHQIMIVRSYLTGKLKLPASRELLEICHMTTHTDKEDFVKRLELWHDKWEYFLNERSADSNIGKTSYKHKRLRSTYLRLLMNLQVEFDATAT